MAGCRPEYLPVVVAAIQAVSEPSYGLAHRQTTTHAGAPLIIVNGPLVKQLKINYGNGVFGPGWRANATIGRALRLKLVNLGGAIPGRSNFANTHIPANTLTASPNTKRRIHGSRCTSSAAFAKIKAS